MTTSSLLRAALACAALAPGAALAQAQAWPGLADASSWTFAGNRLSFPGNAPVATATSRVGLGHVVQTSPAHPVANLRLAFVNFFVDHGGTPDPERCPGNAKTVDFATVFVAGVAYPVTFGGATTVRLGDCEFAWSDPLRDGAGNALVLAPGTTYAVRSSQSVAVGERLALGFGYPLQTRWANPFLGDGVEYSGSVQAGKRLSGTVAAFQNGSAPIGPALAIGTGWDGGPVFLVVGDSLASAQGDLDYSGPRGHVGFVARALDEGALSTRLNFANLAVPGTRPGEQSSIAAGHYRLRLRVLRSIPNRPFNRVFSQMGQNGLFTTLPRWQAEMRDWWRFWSDACPGCPIYQTTPLPRAQQGGNTFWTDPAALSAPVPEIDAWPAGRRWAARAWLLGPGNLPPHVVPLDASPVFGEAADPGVWRVPAGAWTLAAAVSGSVSQLVLAGPVAPTIGDWYVLEPGTPQAQSRQAFNVTGTGPWTVSLTGATTAGRNHAAGVPVLRAAAGDTTHPGAWLNRAGAAWLVERKIDGTLR